MRVPNARALTALAILLIAVCAVSDALVAIREPGTGLLVIAKLFGLVRWRRGRLATIVNQARLQALIISMILLGVSPPSGATTIAIAFEGEITNNRNEGPVPPEWGLEVGAFAGGTLILDEAWSETCGINQICFYASAIGTYQFGNVVLDPSDVNSSHFVARLALSNQDADGLYHHLVAFMPQTRSFSNFPELFVEGFDLTFDWSSAGISSLADFYANADTLVFTGGSGYLGTSCLCRSESFTDATYSQVTGQIVPEPSGALLLMTGLLGLAGWRRSRASY